MGKGKNKESIAQEKKNLLGINPIADHASGSFMSKHSITSNGSNSPLHDSGHGGAEDHTHSTWSNVKNYAQNSSLNNFRVGGGTGEVNSNRRATNTKPLGESRQQSYKGEQRRKKNLAYMAKIDALKKG
tara:strand:- start:22253 stop:22639 length:387 start_codon:yes stop_codon:yes gene_type:complete